MIFKKDHQPAMRHCESIERSMDDLEVPKNKFEELVRNISQFLGKSKGLYDLTPKELIELQQIMSSYESNPADWKKYALFDSCRYTRNLVDEGNGSYNLIVLAWGPRQKSPIHSHSNAHCVMKVLQGSLTETQFAWPEKEGEQMKVKKTNLLSANECTYIHDQMGLHRVGNDSLTEPAVSLHLYTPPIENCKVFCQESSKASTGCPVLFYSKKGELIEYCNGGGGGGVKAISACKITPT